MTSVFLTVLPRIYSMFLCKLSLDTHLSTFLFCVVKVSRSIKHCFLSDIRIRNNHYMNNSINYFIMLFQISRDEAINKVRLDAEEELKGRSAVVFKVYRKNFLIL